MAKVTQSTIINKPPTDVFEVLADPYLILPLLPGLRAVDDVTLPLKAGSSFTWQYQLLGLTFAGKWKVEEFRPPHYYSARSEGGIDSMWIYSLVPKGKATFLTLDIDYGPPNSLLKRYALSFIEPHTAKLAETYLHALKVYLEQSRKKYAV